MMSSSALPTTETTTKIHNMRGDGISTEGVLDVAGALARLGGDEGLYSDMVGFLLEDAPPLFAQLQAAVAGSDAALVSSKAHALKGLLAACGGVRAAETSQVLENAGAEGNLSDAPKRVEQLGTELEQLMEALQKYRR